MKLFLAILLVSAATFVCSKQIDQRIIGGKVAANGQFPYMAAITISKSGSTLFCGGSLLNNEWILTSGQCVDGALLFTILLGTSNLKELNLHSIRVTTGHYVLHPDYNRNTLENDIALIKLRMPITLNIWARPTELLPTEDIVVGSFGIETIGWGQISDQEPGTVDGLRYVYVSALTNEECKLSYGNQIVDTMVCAIGSYNEGLCINDGGGPLVQTWGTRTTLIGIASFMSNNGCESTDPSGYTRVLPYVNWIVNETGIELP